MAVLKLSTPGVYVQEISTMPPSVAEVETAIPAFIGYTQKASKSGSDITLVPTKIFNLSEYELFFGGSQTEADYGVEIDITDHGSSNYTITIAQKNDFKSIHNMYYSVKHFFDNGGSTCYITSVGGYSALPPDPAVVVVPVPVPAPVPGAPIPPPPLTKAEELIKGLDAVQEIDEVTLLVVPEAANIERTDNGAAFKSIVEEMIMQAGSLKDRFALIDPYLVTPKDKTNPSGDIDDDVAFIRRATKGPQMDRYAAAYYPNVVTNYQYNYNFNNLKVTKYTPDTGVTDQALKDKTMSSSAIGESSVLYSKIKSELGKKYVILPPSPSIAGMYSTVDRTKGVWKAPANETLSKVVRPEIEISNREQENLNVDPTVGKSINVIRSFPGYGVLVWGARTLNGNDLEWRYISVRRFFNMVEESIKKSIQWAVFEPNTINTWVKVQAMVENYLFLKWREGALAGEKPEKAYYVRVGLGTTMTSLDVLEGRMNVEIGMAVARPAEFIVLKFSQLLQQS